MKMRLVSALIALAISLPAVAGAQESCPVGSKCVSKEDLDVFVTLLKEKHCLQTEKPAITTDPIGVIIDKDGRIYGTGSSPVPWTLHMKWCGYDVTAQGNVKIDAAMREDPSYGFRFRPKAVMGVLGVEAFKRDPWTQAVDVGVLLDPFFFHAWNLNISVGMRSFGAGVGFDITRNFGAYVGYAMTYSDLRSNPYAGLYFSFW